MHLFSYAMTDKLTNNTVTGTLAVCLNSITHISKTLTCTCIADSLIERLFGNLEQVPDLFTDLANTECVAGITIEAIEKSSAIYRDDIAILQHFLTRNSMNDNIIYRSAHRPGKRPSKRIGKSFECRNSPMVSYIFLSHLVQFCG